MRRLLCAIAVLLLTPSAPALAQDGTDAASAEVIAVLQSARAAHGPGLFEVHPGLDRAARSHAWAMAVHGRLVQVLPGVGDPAERVAAEGVDAMEVVQHVAVGATAVEALRSLLVSDGHRAQLMDPRLTHLGVATAPSQGRVFLTVLLAQLRPEVQVPPPAWQAAPSRPAPSSAALDRAKRTVPAAEVSPVVSAGEPVPEVRVDARGHRNVVGYWVQSQGRWWYYPRPAEARPGDELQPDLSVQGPPPGHAPEPPPSASPPPPVLEVPAASPAAPAPTGGSGQTRVRVTVSTSAPPPVRAPEPPAPAEQPYANHAQAYAEAPGPAPYAAPYGYGVVVVPPPFVVARPIFIGPRVVIGGFLARPYAGWGPRRVYSRWRSVR
jgi:hypothetical protein